MKFKYETDHEDFRPRVIIWQLGTALNGEMTEHVVHRKEARLSSKERMLVLESIARMAKPIIVLTGLHLLQDEEMFALVEYGHALGLKMIVETPPEDITQETLRKYSVFGPRVFRILLDHCIQEDMDTRFRRSTEYYTLERCIRMMKSAGYEIHLGVTVKEPSIRPLAFEHDYAFRKAARGLYCHLNLDRSQLPPEKAHEYTESEIEEFIEAIAKMKRYSPDDMYFSPQCVQYGFVGMTDASAGAGGLPHAEKVFEWKHFCLGGKRFGYITNEGKVQVCSGINIECGDLRMTGFDFQEIWESSSIFREQRENGKSCIETRENINEKYAEDSSAEIQPSVEYMP